MNSTWREFLTRSGANFDPAAGDSLDFGDAPDELQAAAGATVLVPLVHLGVVECSGDDAKTFLHNQLTSDINHLSLGLAQHSSWCTAKGRMLASFLAWRRGDAYQLALSVDLVDAVAKRLQMYVLRAKVKVGNLTDSLVLLGLSGPQAGEALALANLPIPAETLSAPEGGDIKVIRLDTGRFLLAVPAEMAADLWRKLAEKARPAGVPAWRWLDVEAGLPLVTTATREEFVPQMADFEKIGGVSFHKGCYPGQEIVARTQYLGKVKRHLYRLHSDQALAAGDELHSPDNPEQSCGKVVVAAPSPRGGYDALAVVQSNFAGNLRLGAKDGPRLEAKAVNP